MSEVQRAVAVILDGEDAEQARNVFGGGAASAIGASVAAWVDAHVDAEVVQCTDPHVSIGVVLGLSLANGSRRVLKATRPRLALSAALNVQGRLARSGYPAPAIVAGPEQCAAADVVLMTALDSGERVVCDASVRATMAEEFARLVALANEEAPAAALVPAARDTSRVWPTPHSVIFDFDATMEGAEWIDAIAVRTHAVLDADRRPGVVAHGDWSLQNVAFRGQRLVAVFDWDSLTVVPEPIAVARAAAFHCQDWSRGPRGDGASFYPGPADTLDFAEIYARVRGHQWSADERRVLHAALVGSLSYQARCAHALNTNDPGPAAHRLRSFAEALGFTA